MTIMELVKHKHISVNLKTNSWKKSKKESNKKFKKSEDELNKKAKELEDKIKKLKLQLPSQTTQQKQSLQNKLPIYKEWKTHNQK